VRPEFNEARRIGAEEVYNTKAVDVFDALRTSHPDGVEGVVDLVNGSDVIRRDAEILKSGGGLVSTRYAANEEWFAERQITSFNIASTTNPLSSPQGLTKVAHMLVDGMITQPRPIEAATLGRCATGSAALTLIGLPNRPASTLVIRLLPWTFRSW